MTPHSQVHVAHPRLYPTPEQRSRFVCALTLCGREVMNIRPSPLHPRTVPFDRKHIHQFTCLACVRSARVLYREAMYYAETLRQIAGVPR